MFNVGFYRVLADKQFLRNVCVGTPLDHEREKLALALGEFKLIGKRMVRMLR